MVAVLGAFLGWLASEVNFIRQRQVYAARLVRSNTSKEGFGHAAPYPECIFVGCHPAGNWREEIGTPSVPFWRRWLGDQTYGLVAVPAIWPECEVNAAEALFPEACVYWRREELRWFYERKVHDERDFTRWIKFVSHALSISVPPADASQIQTVDDAIRYALQQKSSLRRQGNSAAMPLFACPSI